MEQVELVELGTALLEGTGSYCLRSKKSNAGYVKKNKWLTDRFEEGLKYVQLFENQKQVGFIEYTAAEFSSRVVYAEHYLIIHCLWVSTTGKGHGTALIHKCIDDARLAGKHGVAVVTNSTTSWTPSQNIFLKNGFMQADTAPFGFELLVYKFNDQSDSPSFPTNWEGRARSFDKLTILRSFQCPYVEIATSNVLEGAERLGIEADIYDLQNREELMRLSPTPYGIYSVVYRGQLVAFHRLTVHSVIKRLKQIHATT
ncbi:GNAT family N-acetyltransferase [Paenibacillus sp. JCM 10914]|uniref:GNAT family N-acetyltransferase n=1 Tax=Paenibacillus sp. JCM 10914 TaxID=1236974 RepID=UPI0003CC5C22|nr:GNAT family N-acetyltransferase [Paenibacillus sp. JCM 10914]GAE09501.1 GCN5-related N-acetyltransferase [Paenibacillus sp. JCM 10914]